MTLPIYRTIEGVDGREPVGAVLTIGKKGPSGAPVDNDRFFFVSPYEVNGVRSQLIEFGRFNTADPKFRAVIHGNLVHAHIEDSWLHHLRAQKLPNPNPNPPARKPACTGDGTKATRFSGMDGDDEVWKEIDCPNRLCEFRQGVKAACKPMGRLYFRPGWSHYRDETFHGLPTPLVKWTTGSWNTVANVVGFFDHVRAQAANLGLASWSVYGLPFTLTLGRKTQPQHERAFPVVSISPLVDLVEFFLMQRRQLAAAGGSLGLAAGNTSPEETTPEAMSADYVAVSPGVPGGDAHDSFVAGADVEAELIEGKVEAVEGLVSRLPAGKPRADALERGFGRGMRDMRQVRQLSLDSLTEGLERMRSEATLSTR